MKCPYCNIEMKKGYIPVDNDSIVWILADHKISWTRVRGVTMPGEVELQKMRLLRHSKQPSYRCADCKVIIIKE